LNELQHVFVFYFTPSPVHWANPTHGQDKRLWSRKMWMWRRRRQCDRDHCYYGIIKRRRLLNGSFLLYAVASEEVFHRKFMVFIYSARGSGAPKGVPLDRACAAARSCGFALDPSSNF